MKKIKNILLIVLSLPVLFLSLPALAHADSQNPAKSAIQQGACDASGESNCTPSAATKSINDTISSVINILSVIVGVISVIMIIVGGFRYVTSSGSPEGVTSAKRTILYAIIGLVVATLAQVIARFVLHTATNP